MFALDSIPAVLSITRHPVYCLYVEYSGGDGSGGPLFFLLAKMLKQLRYLHFGLAAGAWRLRRPRCWRRSGMPWGRWRRWG